MLSFDKLLDLLDEHAKLIALSLFSFMIAGAIGGSLYTRSLRSRIAQQEELIADKRIMIEDTRSLQELRMSMNSDDYRAQTRNLERDKIRLEIQIDMFERSAGELLESVEVAEESLEAMNLKRCASSIKSLAFEARRVRNALELARMAETSFDKVADLGTPSKDGSSSKGGSPPEDGTDPFEIDKPEQTPARPAEVSSDLPIIDPFAVKSKGNGASGDAEANEGIEINRERTEEDKSVEPKDQTDR